MSPLCEIAASREVPQYVHEKSQASNAIRLMAAGRRPSFRHRNLGIHNAMLEENALKTLILLVEGEGIEPSTPAL
jgi:hypothetical protein